MVLPQPTISRRRARAFCSPGLKCKGQLRELGEKREPAGLAHLPEIAEIVPAPPVIRQWKATSKIGSWRPRRIRRWSRGYADQLDDLDLEAGLRIPR